MNDTLMHYYLTSAYNVRADLQRAKDFALRYDLPNLIATPEGMVLGDGSKRSGRDRDGFFLTFRGDKLYAGGGDADGGVDYLNVAYEWLSRRDGLMWDVHVGIAMVEFREVGQERGHKFINMLGGFDAELGDIARLGADVSFNLVTAVGGQTAESGDFDQLATYLDIPSLGAFGSFRYDLGSKVPRDVEAGYALNLESHDLGVVRISYNQRFEYVITGTFFRGRFADEGLPNQTLAADSSGVVRWDRIGPFDAGVPLLFSAGLALGDVPGALRFAFVEGTMQLGGVLGLYGRGGAAYGRVQEETVAGYSAGVEALLFDGSVVTRVGLGQRDWEVVDRVGSSDRRALMIFVGGGWSSDSPSPRKRGKR